MMYFGWGLGVSPKLPLTPFTIETFLSKIGGYFTWLGMSQTKYCKHCDRTLPIEKFHKDRKQNDGLAFYCRECTSEQGKKYRETAAGIYYLIKGRQTHFRKIKSSKIKPFKLKLNDFVEWYENEPKICAYCGIPEDKLYIFNEKFNIRGKRLSVDCKNNDLGYTIGNIALACDKCNITKNNALTYEEMLFVGENFIKPKWEALIMTETVKTEED